MQLRTYQNEAITELRKSFKARLRSVILEGPTGCGKTVIFSQLCKMAHHKSLFNRVLIVTDRLNLNDQANDKLNAMNAGNSTDVLTVQTAIRRVENLPFYNIIIVDEAHKKTFDNFIKRMRAKHGGEFLLIGFTATPIRQSKRGPLSDIYEKIISVTTIRELIGAGFLVPAITYGAPFDMKGIKTVRGDYDPAEMFHRFDDAGLYNDVVKRYNEHAPNSKAICFCINVAHSIRTMQAFRAAGIKAAHIDGNTPTAERRMLLKAFEVGTVRVLCNCDLYTTGFDEPSIQTVILNRATRSIPLFLQMCGRGSRPFTGSNGNKKNSFTIIDMGNNVFTCGFWQQDREFSLDPLPLPKAGIAPVKDCRAMKNPPEGTPKKGCGALIPASTAICKFCGAVQPVKAKVEKVAGSFVQLDPAILERDPATLTFNELDQVRRLKKYKFGWLVRKVVERGQLEEFAKERGYSNGWVFHQKQYYNL